MQLSVAAVGRPMPLFFSSFSKLFYNSVSTVPYSPSSTPAFCIPHASKFSPLVSLLLFFC